jgi:hypothetical protein
MGRIGLGEIQDRRARPPLLVEKLRQAIGPEIPLKPRREHPPILTRRDLRRRAISVMCNSVTCLSSNAEAPVTRKHILPLLQLLFAIPLLGQIYPYVISTVAGANPLGDGGPATSALLEFPTAVAVDNSSGFVYINDRINGRIRQISPSGTISTFLPAVAADFKVDASGQYPCRGRRVSSLQSD